MSNTYDIDFNESNLLTSGYDGVGVQIGVDPDDSSNAVLEYVKSTDAKYYSGAIVRDPAAGPIPIDADGGLTQMSARVYVAEANTVVRMQLAVSSAGSDASTTETEAIATQAGWNELVFDFSNPAVRWVEAFQSEFARPIDTNAVYDQVTMIIDYENGLEWDGSQVGSALAAPATYYIDDIAFVAPEIVPFDQPETFEGDMGQYSIVEFDNGTGSAAVVADPTDASNTVLSFTKSSTSEHFAGMQVANQLGGVVGPIAFDSNSGATQMGLRVYAAEAGTEFRMQIEDSSGSTDANYVMTSAVTYQTGWNDLVFDFSKPVARWVEAESTDLIVSLDDNATYDTVSIFSDWRNGLDGAGGQVGDGITADETYYFDNLTFLGPQTGYVRELTDFVSEDFENNGAYGVLAFENGGVGAMLVDDPTDPGNDVIAFTKHSGSKFYSGMQIGNQEGGLIGDIPLDPLTGVTQIGARVWAAEAGKAVRMQVESSTAVTETGGADDSYYVTAEALTTQAGWNDLVFDFSQPVAKWVAAWGNENVGRGLQADVTYDRMTMMFDYANGLNHANAQIGTPITADATYYVDDIAVLGLDTASSGPTAGSIEPEAAAEDVISLLGDGYTSAETVDWFKSWSNDAEGANTQHVGTADFDGNTAQAYTNVTTIGIEPAAPVDITGMGAFNISVWRTDDSAELKIKLVDYGPDGAWKAGGTWSDSSDDTEHEIILSGEQVPAGQWTNISIPLSDFSGLTGTSAFAQMVISSHLYETRTADDGTSYDAPIGSGETLYIDNVSFSKSVLTDWAGSETGVEPITVGADQIGFANVVVSNVSQDVNTVSMDVVLPADIDNLTGLHIDLEGISVTNLVGINGVGIDTWRDSGGGSAVIVDHDLHTNGWNGGPLLTLTFDGLTDAQIDSGMGGIVDALIDSTYIQTYSNAGWITVSSQGWIGQLGDDGTGGETGGTDPVHIQLYSSDTSANPDHPNHWNGVDAFGSGATFNGDATDPTGTYGRVFEVASGEAYGAGVHVGFAAFTGVGAGFASGADHFNAKVYGSPLGNLEVKLIGAGEGLDSVATIDLSTYAGSLDEGNGWYSVSIPFSEFTNAGEVTNHSGYLIGPPGDQGDAPWTFYFTDVELTEELSMSPLLVLVERPVERILFISSCTRVTHRLIQIIRTTGMVWTPLVVVRPLMVMPLIRQGLMVESLRLRVVRRMVQVFMLDLLPLRAWVQVLHLVLITSMRRFMVLR